MGNNESLPPPPPPPPVQPPVPPAPPLGPPAYQPPPPPGYNPPTTQNPTTQFPATQRFPPTQAFPGGPPGGFPPNGSTGFEQSPEPPKKKTGLMTAGGLVAIAAVVAVVLVLTGRDDDKTIAPEFTPASTVFVSIPEITLAPLDTSVVTLPVITEPVVTEPATTVPSATGPVVVSTIVSGGEITDGVGVFKIVLPDGLAVDTAPITTKDNFVLPSVAGAVDLQAFYQDDVTPGFTSIVVREDVQSTPAEVLTFLEPGAGICAGREQVDAYPTAIGSSILLELDGCGDGTAAKVILVAAIEGSTSIIALYVQGPGTSAELLLQAQMVFESIRLL